MPCDIVLAPEDEAGLVVFDQCAGMPVGCCSHGQLDAPQSTRKTTVGEIWMVFMARPPLARLESWRSTQSSWGSSPSRAAFD